MEETPDTQGFLTSRGDRDGRGPNSRSTRCHQRARGPRPRKRGAQCRGRRRFAVAAVGRTTAPTRDVVFIPSALAAAAVRSKDAPLANGPRSTTGTTSEWPAYQFWTGVPQGTPRWATPTVERVSRAPHAVRRP